MNVTRTNATNSRPEVTACHPTAPSRSTSESDSGSDDEDFFSADENSAAQNDDEDLSAPGLDTPSDSEEESPQTIEGQDAMTRSESPSDVRRLRSSLETTEGDASSGRSDPMIHAPQSTAQRPMRLRDLRGKALIRGLRSLRERADEDNHRKLQDKANMWRARTLGSPGTSTDADHDTSGSQSRPASLLKPTAGDSTAPDPPRTGKDSHI